MTEYARVANQTCIVLGDAGKLLVQEALQAVSLCAEDQALDQLQVYRGWVVLHHLQQATVVLLLDFVFGFQFEKGRFWAFGL